MTLKSSVSKVIDNFNFFFKFFCILHVSTMSLLWEGKGGARACLSDLCEGGLASSLRGLGADGTPYLLARAGAGVLRNAAPGPRKAGEK